MIKQVKKRDGRIVDFDQNKITEAIAKAFKATTGRSDFITSNKLSELVVKKLEVENLPSVEEVQDAVESVLMENSHSKIARSYILYRERHNELRKEKQAVLEKEEIDEVDKKFDINALRVLKSRYLRKDENGKLLETPKQLFTRVAVHTALPNLMYDSMVFDKKSFHTVHSAEDFDNKENHNIYSIGKYKLNMYHMEALKRMYDRMNKECKMKVTWSDFLGILEQGGFDKYEKDATDFYNLFVSKQFVANTPAMANFGEVLGMGSACFHPDQLIITQYGPKKISEIKEGESVLTHKGRFKKVTEIFKRQSNELFEISCKKLPNKTMSVTAEHPILCYENGRVEWKHVSDLNEGDMVATSYPNEVEDVDTIFVGETVGIPVENDTCVYSYKGGNCNAFEHKTKAVKNTISVDADLMLVFGYYLSEGNVSDDGCLRFTFSEDEEQICNGIISIIKNKFGIDSIIERTNREDRKWISLRFHSTILAKFFKALFSTGFDKKTIPSWILKLPIEKQKGMILGMLKGDGTIFKNYKQYNARAVMCNHNLIYAFWQMCMRLDIFASLKVEPIPKLGTKNPVSCTIGTDGYEIINQAAGRQIQQLLVSKKQYIKVDGTFFTPVAEINRIAYGGLVYNLEVEEDHTYVANMVSVHNCFVIDVEDSIEKIMSSLSKAATIFKSGGGVGYNFSKLRPEGDFVSTTCGVASGPISFMTLFDKMTEVIKQGGIRRGANMGILNSNHPDIEKFITAKEGNKQLKNFNISVLIMPDFWDYYERNEPYPLLNPRTKQVVKTVDPRKLFDKMVYQAWESAEPGIIFYDKVNDTNPFYEHLGPIVTTNPCVAGDTKVLTENGWLEIQELAKMENYPNLLVDARTLSYNHNQSQIQIGLLSVKAEKIWKTGTKETIIISTKLGKKLKLTKDHKVLLSKGWIEASEIKLGDIVLVQDGTGNHLEEYVSLVQNGEIIDVYDITEPQTHSFIANGIIVHNCGEVLLYPNEPCNLGSINVWAFVKEDREGNIYYDWDELKNVVMLTTTFLDNVIDVNKFPLQEIEEMSLATRKIGLGVMGLGDLLYELGIPYNSESGRKLMEKILEFINYYSKLHSIELAEERGPLPYYEKSFYIKGKLPIEGFNDKDSWNLDWSKISEDVKTKGIRNGFTIVIAPTGSISMIAGCSSGIEPVYALAFEKNVKVGSFYYINPIFEKVLKEKGLYTEELMSEIVKNNGSVKNILYLPKDIRDVFITALDTIPEDHIRALAACQKWVDSSISKTNNFPADATVEYMRDSYIMAYKLGCKDVTVYRDKSIQDQVLVAGEAKKSKETKPSLTEAIVTTMSHGSVTLGKTKFDYKECPECNSKVELKEGCVSCSSCGWGLCS